MTGTLLHIGAGRGSRPMATTSVLNMRRTVLVEPDPALASLLRSKNYGLNSVKVLEKAVKANAPEAEYSSFFRCNYRLFSGLHPDMENSSAFPSLKITSEFSVPIVSATNCLKEAEIDLVQDNALIIELPDGEAEIVEELGGNGQIRGFRWITIRLFEKASSDLSGRWSRISGMLGDHGFECGRSDTRDPMFVILTMDRNHRAADQVKFERCEKKLTELTSQLSKAHDELHLLKKEVEDLTGLVKQADVGEQRKSALVGKLEMVEQRNLELDKAREELRRMTDKCAKTEKVLRQLQAQTQAFESAKSKIRDEMERVAGQVKLLERYGSQSAHDD